MADVNKPKLQLRSGLSTNGDKSPSPVTKLLINHGKPNFTIPRTHKMQNGNTYTTLPTPAKTGNFQNNNNNNNNNEFVVKSTTFNGVFKPSNISAATKQTLPQNGNTFPRNGNIDNEAAKVVLRRPKFVQTETREQDDDENVPEFIRRQRRIQERLANQNILDFENRRSGYFTQVMITPSSPNRKSFVETMASPAVKPGLEMPVPTVQHENIKIEATTLKEQDQEVEHPKKDVHQEGEIENGQETISLEPINLNGLDEEEEVAKAIEEVNKAVAGEDDDKAELEDNNNEDNEDKVGEETQSKEDEEKPEFSYTSENTQEQKSPKLGEDEAANVAVSATADKVEDTKSNGYAEGEHHENGHSKPEELDTGVTIFHANSNNEPRIPTPDPSGEKGVNYETKTVVSFSQELGNGDNKYPDTVKVVKVNEVSEVDSELKELTKLKFEIKADNQEIEVKPVLVKETY